MNWSIKAIGLSLLVSLAGFFSTCYSQGSKTPVNRPAIAAGSFYPDNKTELEAKLAQLFKEAESLNFEGDIQSLIVPHAGYAYSGKVAASAYKSIPEGAEYKNVFIIATSQHESFNGASVYNQGNYITPLGNARVNKEIADDLLARNKSLNYHHNAHEKEHRIEVQVPFIQYHLGDIPIVPILLGSSSIATARDLAAALVSYFTPDNLFIISTNFSQYPSYSDALRIDQLTSESIERKDPEDFYNTLRKNSQESIPNLSTSAYGWSSIMTFLYLAQREYALAVSPVLYLNSGDLEIGNRERVVGYWAIAASRFASGTMEYTLTETNKETLLDIARKTLDLFIQTGELYEVSQKTLAPILNEPAGVFMELYMGERLRGGIGDFNPSNPLYLVVQELVLAAATHDERFAPVEKSDLDYIEVKISVLTPLQKITSLDQFQLGKHGIYMTRDGKSGTYLPQVAEESGWNTEEFLGHCAREQAGLGWDGWKDADLYVFEAIVFGEEKK